jgi:hypothetical protein
VKAELRARDEVAQALLVTLRAPVSSARFTFQVWMSRRLVAPTEISLGCRLAKGDTVEEIEVLSVATIPLHEQRIAPRCAPGSESLHAASFGGIARGLPRLFHPLVDAPL